MAIRVALNHTTRYRYDRPVALSPQIVRLRPAPHCRTPVSRYSLRIEPSGHLLKWQQDPHANYVARVVFPERVEEFRIEVDLVAELSAIDPFDFLLERSAERVPFRYEPELARELSPFLETWPPGPRLAAFLDSIDRREQRTTDFLVGLNQTLSRVIRYLIRMEPGVQTAEETLARGSGSCRDSAWLLVEILRQLGLAARFVSGYLIQLRPDQEPLADRAGAGDDFTDLHAWSEVYLPGAGWVGLDPTSGLLAGESHLPVAATRNPASAAPVTGTVERCQVEFEFALRVRQLHEAPSGASPSAAT